MNEKKRASLSQNEPRSSVNGYGCSRSVFLQRIRDALVVPAAADHASSSADGEMRSLAQAPRDLSLVRLVGREADCVAVFIERATAGGLRVHLIKPNELLKAVADVLNTCGVQRAAMSVPGLLGQSLRDSLASRGVALVATGVGGTLDALYDADAGVTDCDAGLAESGTIVVRGDADRSRGTFIVPPVHVAILRASQILPDMLDYWASLDTPDKSANVSIGLVQSVPNGSRKLPTSIVMVSGPSKTADIEGILITGVHGPREVHVVLVDDR